MYTQLNIELSAIVEYRVNHENGEHAGDFNFCLKLRCLVLKNKMPSTLELLYAEAARHIISSSREKKHNFSGAIIISISQSKLTIIKRCGTNLNIEQLIHIQQKALTLE
jgi:hypothetical protein